jgi:hypothetical protein
MTSRQEAFGIDSVRHTVYPIRPGPPVSGEILGLYTGETQHGVRLATTPLQELGEMAERIKSVNPRQRRYTGLGLGPSTRQMKSPSEVVVKHDDVVTRQVSRGEQHRKNNRIEARPCLTSKIVASQQIDVMPF